MTYFDSAADTLITKARAWSEFKAHGSTHDDFELFLMDVIADPSTVIDDEGYIRAVDAQAALAWLGY